MPAVKDILNVGYTNDKRKQKEFAKKHGYHLDEELSNHNHQVYHNPQTNELIHNTNGTQNNLKSFLTDWHTNLQIGLGRGKNTDRYKEEKGNLEKAKKKYNPSKTTITGHSQGGFHASNIGDKDDKIVTYNKASIPFTPSNSNEKHYRTKGDVVSIGAIGQKHTEVIPEKEKSKSIFPFNSLYNLGKNVLNSHDIKHLDERVAV
jgi:hypothetical protein